ncbi:MAG TPA: tRNA lysidine(34) synthetase TilS [Bacteroidia bacterium]|nr:tRNA lysidine(34) synthetase TilS [Bacteroidia bacterium]HNS11671.1 tRNA lysidine(34) synthetase TilS [Bacteroidia bacterium]
MQDRFLQFCKANSVLGQKKKILLAVSGGLDSVVMFDLFYRSGIPIAVAHCNFGLRDKESDGDESFVKRLCVKNKIDFHRKKFNTKSYAQKHKTSIQVAARELRYEWFNELIETESYQLISTAHHLDDSIETFFINLLRGTGLKGLTGIPSSANRLIRPLSDFSRAEILSYAKSKKLKWREDSSNTSEDYLRNRIRKNLSPILLKMQPELHEVMRKNLSHLQGSNSLLEEYGNLLKEKFVSQNDKDIWKINIESLSKEGLATEKLQLILSGLGIKTADIQSMLKVNDPGKEYKSGDLRILRDRKHLIIQKSRAAGQDTLLIPETQDEILYMDKRIQFKKTKPGGSKKAENTVNIENLDAAKLIFPLQLRVWKPGDSFYPLGMKQRKKVSDFLIDQKIDRFEKEKCSVLLSGTDIVCILGLRIDDRFKITTTTKTIFSIHLTDI